jgi:hypothetical protein
MKKRKKHNKRVIKDLYSWLHKRGEIGNYDEPENEFEIESHCETMLHNIYPELFIPGDLRDHFEY